MNRPGISAANIWWLHPAAVFGIAGPLIGVIAYAFRSPFTGRIGVRPSSSRWSRWKSLWLALRSFMFGSILSSTWNDVDNRRPSSRQQQEQLPLDLLEQTVQSKFLSVPARLRSLGGPCGQPRDDHEHRLGSRER